MAPRPWHSAFAPATIANLGPGFDVLGLALDPALGLGDRCEVRLADHDRLDITITGDGGRLPTDPDQNCATVVARRVLEIAGARTGLDLRLHKGLPLGSGLGSSAASSASAALAANLALGSPLTRRELIPAALAGEAVAAGLPHPDNVVPSLLGGILLMVDEPSAGLQIVRLPVPPGLRAAVVIPDQEVRTADARRVLPERVPLGDAIANAGRIGLFVSALYDGDLARLGLGVEDRLHQPYRKSLMRGFDEARQAALEAGALGVGLSGSGPAMFALADGQAAAERAGEAFVAAFEALGIAARYAAGGVSAPTG